MAVKDGLQAIAKIFRYGGYASALVGIMLGVIQASRWSMDAAIPEIGGGLLLGAFLWLVGWVVDKFAL